MTAAGEEEMGQKMKSLHRAAQGVGDVKLEKQGGSYICRGP